MKQEKPLGNKTTNNLKQKLSNFFGGPKENKSKEIRQLQGM